MPSPRAVIFRNGYVYHLFNRGVERRPIFFTARDYERFVSLVEYYRFHRVSKSYSHYLALSLADRTAFRRMLEQSPTAVDVLAYCLMPNHFHILVKQNTDGGIHRFLSNVANGYAKYINAKRKRVGPLYQGPFKAVLAETDEQLIHLSRYIHINPIVSNIITEKELAAYPWSSFPEYVGHTAQPFADTREILHRFKNNQAYKKFVYDHIAYAKELEKIKHLALEEV